MNMRKVSRVKPLIAFSFDFIILGVKHYISFLKIVSGPVNTSVIQNTSTWTPDDMDTQPGKLQQQKMSHVAR
jgi:hypothetical protein